MRERRVGIRTLKSKLSEYMGAVKAGTTIVVTEHGRQIARIIPETNSGEQTLEVLRTAGTILWSGRRLDALSVLFLQAPGAHCSRECRGHLGQRDQRRRGAWRFVHQRSHGFRHRFVHVALHQRAAVDVQEHQLRFSRRISLTVPVPWTGTPRLLFFTKSSGKNGRTSEGCRSRSPW